jgi:type II secretory ATPase GspE/PulE/Tfp pilus assembly ATPase PilB-like protein
MKAAAARTITEDSSSRLVDASRTMRSCNKVAKSAALELARDIFVEENEEGPGVRLRKASAKAASIPIEDLNAENDE